jgi:hypothetical protein
MHGLLSRAQVGILISCSRTSGTVVKFAEIQKLLDDAIGNVEIGEHGAFWRGITRDQFVAKRVFGRTVVIPGNGDRSNLVKAFRGEAPFGSDIGTPSGTMTRMPAGMKPVSPKDIARIVDWIDAGCPE